MHYTLAPNLHYCPIGERSVFLDLSRDRYFLLESAGEDRFQRFIARSANEVDIAWLAAKNIVTSGPGKSADSRPNFEAPQSSLVDSGLPLAPLAHTTRAMLAQIAARRMVKRLQLADILVKTESIYRGSEPENHLQVLRVTAAFQRARRYFPAIDQCLVRSIAMKQMLARQGCKVDFVIGVTLPFSAHSWVQHGPVILTDPFDLVQAYKPILVM